MTRAADTNSENESNNVPALTASRDPSGIEPVVAAASASSDTKARTFASRLLDYSAHAAMIVGLVGFAWTVSNHVVMHPAASPSQAPAKAAAVAPAAVDELADLRQSNRQMSDDIRRLRANLDALRASVHDDRTSAQVRVLQAGLETVQNGLATTRNETAQLTGKIDKVAHEPAAKLQQLSERVGKLEKGAVDTTATASIPTADAAKAGATVPVPPTKPIATKPANARLASAEAAKTPADAGDDAARPQVIPGYVVRDVYEGVALIEGRRGTMEVVPGVGIPGAGIVKSIDRKGRGWTVTTTKGLLAYAAPPSGNRRADRPAHDFYPPYREDF